jgi:hypothetical protein
LKKPGFRNQDILRSDPGPNSFGFVSLILDCDIHRAAGALFNLLKIIRDLKHEWPWADTDAFFVDREVQFSAVSGKNTHETCPISILSGSSISLKRTLLSNGVADHCYFGKYHDIRGCIPMVCGYLESLGIFDFAVFPCFDCISFLSSIDCSFCSLSTK